MTTDWDGRLTVYAEELAKDPEFVAEGLANDVIDELLMLLQSRDENQSWLAEQLGVTRSYVSNLLHAKPNMTMLTVAKLALALGVTPGVTLDVERFPICHHPALSGTELEDQAIDGQVFYGAASDSSTSSSMRRLASNATA